VIGRFVYEIIGRPGTIPYRVMRAKDWLARSPISGSSVTGIGSLM